MDKIASPQPKSASQNPPLTHRIFSEVFNVYTGDGERVPALDGLHRLEEIAALSHLPGDALLHPRKRVTVMIIGNHSAGKSSFINWYCEQAVLATGVAVESQGFTVITHGRDPTPIKGEGTIIENKHLKAVADRLGKDRTTFVEYLSTLHVTKPSKEMAHVYLIDTPGLVDGDMSYPFEVNKTIAELAEVSDLIFVFLDPIGQALVSRTMNVVKDLNLRGHFSKMRYFLTKADTVASRADLNKFDIPCIWLPSADSSERPPQHQSPADMNSLPKLCDTISNAVTKKVQDNMERAERDCARLLTHLEEELDSTEKQRRVRSKWACYTWLLAPALVVLGAFAFLDVLLVVEPRLPSAVRDAPLTRQLIDSARPPMQLIVETAGALGWGAVGLRLQAVAAVFLLLSTLVQFFRCRMRGLVTRSGLSKDALLALRSDVDALLRHVETLHSLFSRAPKIAEYD